MPVTALIVVLRAHIVRVVLGSGQFDWTDTRLTAAVLALLRLPLTAQGITLLLLRAYYAAGRTFVPFLVSCVTGVLTIIIATLFEGSLHDSSILVFAQNHACPRSSGNRSSCAGARVRARVYIRGLRLLIHFEHRFGRFLAPNFSRLVGKPSCNLSRYFSAITCSSLAGPLDVGSTTLSVFLKGFSGGIVGIVAAGAVYWLLGSIELKETILSRSTVDSSKALLSAQEGVEVATSAEDQPGQS
jgi:hypothetical protein